MKRFSIGLFMALIFCACQKKEVSVGFVVKDRNPGVVEISLSEFDTTLTLDAEAKASVMLPITEPQYGSVRYKFKNMTAYFEPGKGFTTIFDMTPSGLEISFEGDGAAKNSFINNKDAQLPVMGDFGLQEAELLAKLEQYKMDNYKVLEGKNFDSKFEDKEKHRINYAIYGMLWQYARGSERSEKVYETLRSLMLEDEWLLQLNAYQNYMQGAVSILATRGQNVQDVSKKEMTMSQLNYVMANIKNPKIKEFLVGTFAISYIDKEGIEEAEPIKKIFEENVTDPEVIAIFDKIYAEGTTVTKGKKAPGFKYQDINGKEVSLADLKGKLVYIDIWATWCGPCREELPSLQKLEQAFKGTNVCFVSISTDKDKAKWEQMVKAEKLGGIQLHAGGDTAFTDAFRVQGIPHFILIDAEGKIMEANMTRPSDPKTAEYLSMFAEFSE